MNKNLLCGLIGAVFATPVSALDLVEAYQRALTTDASWQANQLRYQVEQQNLGIAKAAILPTVGVNATINKQYQNQDQNANSSIDIGGEKITFYNSNTTTKQATASIRQPLFRMDVWQKYQQVKISQTLAELKLQAQKQQLLLDVAQKYFNVLRQDSLYRVYRQEEQSLLVQYQMMDAKYQEGLVARMDVSEAQAQYQSAIAKRIAGEVQQQLAREELEQYIGQVHGTLAQLSSDFQYQAPMPNDINPWVDIAQRNNLDLNQRRVNYQVAQQQIKVDQASYYPQIEATASSTWSKQSPESIINSEGRIDKIGLEFSWNAFDGTRSSLIKKSRLEASAAKSDIDTLQKQVRTDVKRAFLQVSSAYSQLNAYKVAMDSAQLVADASQASYQEGLKTMVDVLLAQRNAFSARQDYVNAQYDYILNVLQLRASSGQLDEQDLQQFNAWLE